MDEVIGGQVVRQEVIHDVSVVRSSRFADPGVLQNYLSLDVAQKDSETVHPECVTPWYVAGIFEYRLC